MIGNRAGETEASSFGAPLIRITLAARRRAAMGLATTVGAMIGWQEDEGALESLKADLAQLNGLLRASGLPEHKEPVRSEGVLPVSYEMYGYSGLHHLRRLAALLRTGKSLSPVRDGEDPSCDPILDSYYSLCDWTVGENGTSVFRSPEEAGGRFDHLVFHSDADGYYLPIAMDGVLVTWQEGDEYSKAVGSSGTLMQECEALAEAMGLPLDLDPESEEVWNAADDQRPDATGWKRFGIEAFTCIRLYHAARASNATGAAVVFH
ncbi:MAG: hypothetical protein ACYS9X_12390 [Planctomycetota bacterium]